MLQLKQVTSVNSGHVQVKGYTKVLCAFLQIFCRFEKFLNSVLCVYTQIVKNKPYYLIYIMYNFNYFCL